MGEELHSQFIEQLLKCPDDVIAAERGGYINVYCVGIIFNHWNTRNKYKITVGNTSDLFMYTNTANFEPSQLEKYYTQSDYNITIDYKTEKVKKLIEKEFNHSDIKRMYKARTFYYSQPIEFIKKGDKDYYKVCGSIIDYSKKSKIPYQAVAVTCHRFKKWLQNKLK